MHPHVAVHRISLCKNFARASGGANNMHPVSWLVGGGGGGQTEKTRYFNLKNKLLPINTKLFNP